MPDYTIRDPQSGKTVTVRGSSPPSESELNLIFKSVTPTPGTSGGPTMAAASKAVPMTAQAAEELATNPTVPALAAKAGRFVGGVTPALTGLAEGSPTDSLLGVLAASKGAWAGGKTGWFTGKLAQSAAAPIATILQKAAPYMQALTTLGGVQSALDLAQMADPKRQDIGFLGIGSGTPDPDHPALLNLALSKARDAIQSLISHHDMTPEQAAQTLLQSRKGSK